MEIEIKDKLWTNLEYAICFLWHKYSKQNSIVYYSLDHNVALRIARYGETQTR